MKPDNSSGLCLWYCFLGYNPQNWSLLGPWKGKAKVVGRRKGKNMHLACIEQFLLFIHANLLQPTSRLPIACFQCISQFMCSNLQILFPPSFSSPQLEGLGSNFGTYFQSQMLTTTVVKKCYLILFVFCCCCFVFS